MDFLLKGIYDRSVVDSYITLFVGFPSESEMTVEWMRHHEAAEVVVKP